MQSDPGTKASVHGSADGAAGTGTLPNILLVSIDTLRADHLSGYGYQRSTSPFLDELAGRGVRFSNAFVNTHGTAPSHATMLSSTYQEQHRVAYQAGEELRALPEQLDMLQHILGRAGYRTVGITGGGNVGSWLGFGRGFDHFDDRARGVADGANRLHQALQSLEDEDKPRFVFFHTYEVHSPYSPPPAYQDRFGTYESSFLPTSENLMQHVRSARRTLSEEDLQHIVAQYDGGIVYTDEVLRQIFATLESSGLLERALVVITSDHGEEFAEHGGLLHRGLLYDELLQVPLLVYGNGLSEAGIPQGVEDSRMVSSIDIVPTVLACVGLEKADGLQGRPLLCGGEEEGAEETHEAEAVISQYGSLRYSVRTPGWKLIETTEPPRLELYDLVADPGERSNLAQQERRRVAQMRGLLREWLSRQQAQTLEEGSDTVLSEEEIERLRALGYIDG